MPHFGAISPPGPSHVTGMTTLGRELCRRGHRFTIFNIPDVEALAQSEGSEFCPLGAQDNPLGSFRSYSEKLSTLHGLPALRFGLAKGVEEIAMLLRDAPDALRSRGIDALLVDQMQPAGSTLAEDLGIPFITICNAVANFPDPSVPSTMTPWQYSDQWLARLRNGAIHSMIELGLSPFLRPINQFRRRSGLKPLSRYRESLSPLAVISQQTPDLDFPNPSRPRNLHHIGLFRRTGSSQVPFPFERLDGRPVVYATLGTIHSDSYGLLHNLSEACRQLDLQLVITLGGKPGAVDYSALPGSPILVPNAPQLAVLERTAITFCHGGNNTVLESLAAGVPVLAMPIFGDQFGSAARLIRSGAGAIVPLRPSSDQIHDALRRIQNEPRYRERAQAIRHSIEVAGGEQKAADIIEAALKMRAPDSQGSASATPRL